MLFQTSRCNRFQYYGVRLLFPCGKRPPSILLSFFLPPPSSLVSWLQSPIMDFHKCLWVWELSLIWASTAGRSKFAGPPYSASAPQLQRFIEFSGGWTTDFINLSMMWSHYWCFPKKCYCRQRAAVWPVTYSRSTNQHQHQGSCFDSTLSLTSNWMLPTDFLRWRRVLCVL